MVMPLTLVDLLRKKIDYDYKINEINAKYVVLLAYLLLLILITLKIKYPALLI